MNYLNKLTSAVSAQSSKRFIALFSLLLFTACTIALIAGVTLPDSLIWALVTMITGQSALTMMPARSTPSLKPDREDENSETRD